MKCEVMGIVNVTPDSFSDGGKYFRPEEAIRRAHNLIDEGAAVVDIGGESTKPGATPIGWEEEWSRVEPVLRALAQCGTRLSIDTYHPETAERAVAAGATVVNCVYAEPAKEMLRFLSMDGVGLVVPASIAEACPQRDGKVDERIYLDPMIGFGTSRDEDIGLLRSITELSKRGRVLVGASRKRIVKRLTGEKTPGKDIAGNITIAVWAALNGASMVRVHDVRETVQAMKVVECIWNSRQ